jgi:hypothetical protein
MLALEIEFAANYMGKFHWLVGIQIAFNRDLITHQKEAFIDKILEWF